MYNKINFLEKEVKEMGEQAIKDIQGSFFYMAKIRLEKIVTMNDELNRLKQKL